MTTVASSLVDHLPQFSSSLSPYISDALKSSNLVTAFVLYLAAVRVLRFKRHREIHRIYQKKYEDRTLTPEEAQKVMLVSSGYDMPLLLNCSLAFVLFKTYGLPSISKLLSATKQLKSSETVSRRYADVSWTLLPLTPNIVLTGPFVPATWVGCPISGYVTEDKSGELDPRAMIALARVNYLHSKYNISNGDFLYTLILFAVEPATWARWYGWRALSPLEEYAYCIFWVEIGKRMGIKDIPETPEAMRAWAKVNSLFTLAYEEEYMVPDPINKEVADYTTEELLYAVPTAFGIRDWFEGLIACMLDDTSQVVGAEQGDGATAIASPSADGQTLIPSVSGSMQPPPPLGTRPVGMDEDVDVDDELLPAMADDDYSAQQSWNTQSKDNLKILMDNFTPEQYERFEAYRRHALPKQAVRKVIQQSLGQQVSQPVAQIIAGFSKVFVGEIVEKGKLYAFYLSQLES
ncbi:Transcription initiation factor TFIID subunit 11 [Leucoagaricus sp. SymC.cos]|nr:Transcription initiation factor TFIID subunit 11 [Leucoagaricus sp. SymC.cos]